MVTKLLTMMDFGQKNAPIWTMPNEGDFYLLAAPIEALALSLIDKQQ